MQSISSVTNKQTNKQTNALQITDSKGQQVLLLTHEQTDFLDKTVNSRDRPWQAHSGRFGELFANN